MELYLFILKTEQIPDSTKLSFTSCGEEETSVEWWPLWKINSKRQTVDEHQSRILERSLKEPYRQGRKTVVLCFAFQMWKSVWGEGFKILFLCVAVCPGTRAIFQAGLKLTKICLPVPQSAKIKDVCRHSPAQKVFLTKGMKYYK